jgi:hypothetical protein
MTERLKKPTPEMKKYENWQALANLHIDRGR